QDQHRIALRQRGSDLVGVVRRQADLLAVLEDRVELESSEALGEEIRVRAGVASAVAEKQSGHHVSPGAGIGSEIANTKQAALPKVSSAHRADATSVHGMRHCTTDTAE